MAGSYEHLVDDQGRLLSPQGLADNLDTHGDVVEALSELYGMVWWLAQEGNPIFPPDVRVEIARDNHLTGLRFSPGLAADHEIED